jgi:hypothetical protein
MPPASASQSMMFSRIVVAKAATDALNLHRNLSEENASEYLAGLWEIVGRKWLGSGETAHGLSLRRHELSDRIRADVIHMPEPRVPPEAFYLAVVYWMETAWFGERLATAGKAFTLELGNGTSRNEREYPIWEKWGVFRETSHCHGTLVAADEDAFVAFVQGILGHPPDIVPSL